MDKNHIEKLNISYNVIYFQGTTRRDSATLTEIGVDLIIEKYGKFGPVTVTKTEKTTYKPLWDQVEESYRVQKQTISRGDLS